MGSGSTSGLETRTLLILTQAPGPGSCLLAEVVVVLLLGDQAETRLMG